MSLYRWFALLALCLFAAMPAHAKRGFLLINTGDEMFEVADFPAEVVQAIPAAKTAKVGYKCSHFGILFADVWTWDCKLVGVISENSYADLPEDVTSKLSADPQYAFGKAKRGLWNHYGFWAALVVVLGVAAALLMGRSKSDPEPEEAAA